MRPAKSHKKASWSWAPFAVLSLYLSVFAVLEVVQCHFGQSLFHAVADISLYSFILLIVFIVGLSSLPIFVVLCYVVFETYSYAFTHDTLNTQFLISTSDLSYAVQDHIEYLFEGIAMAALVALFAWLPRRKWSEALFIPLVNITVVVQLALFAGFFFTRKVRNGLFPLGAMTFLDTGGNFTVRDGVRAWDPFYEPQRNESEIERIERYFNTPLMARIHPGMKAKNYVLILGESLEKQVIGEFNPRGFNKSMPYLSQLSNNGTFCINMPPAMYTTWSVGANFVHQCGMPFIVHNILAGNRAEIVKYHHTFKCIGDILTKVGYHGVYVMPGNTGLGGMRNIFVGHGLNESYDGKEGITLDWQMMEKFQEILPRLVNNYEKKGQPFYLMLGPEDTHPRYHFDKCTPRIEITGTEKAIQAFDCLDQRIEIIVNTLKKYGLNSNNTVLAVHGDHPVMGPTGSFTTNQGHTRRPMFVSFPWEKKVRITKRVSHYDISPTVLDLLHIDYKPKFPFGLSVYNNETSNHPSVESCNYLFSKYHL